MKKFIVWQVVIAMAMFFFGCTKPNTVDWEKIFGDKDVVPDGIAETDDELWFDADEGTTDETVVEDATVTEEEGNLTEDDPIEPDDAVDPSDDTVETGDDTIETGDDAVEPDEDVVDIDTADIETVEVDTFEADIVDIDTVDEDTVDIQPDLDVDLYVDTTPPTVTATMPLDTATDVAIGTTIEMSFSEPMNETTLTTTTITVVDETPATVNGDLVYNVGNYTAVFTPSASLGYDTVYTVTVTTGVEDLAGNPLAADYEFSFTTAANEINECIVNNNPCDDASDSGATCTDIIGGYTCTCSSGFAPGGGTCQDVNECTLDTDNCAQNCQNTVGSHTCTCNNGYTLNGDGHACNDINECVTLTNPCNDNGDTGGSCTNTDGGYTCTCSSGYGFSGGSCRDINECLTLSNPCDDFGDTGAMCSNLAGSYLCTCSSTWFVFQNGACRDVDECVTQDNPCEINGDIDALCENTLEGYTCDCSSGWFDNGTTCDNFDNCVGHLCNENGDGGATCQDGTGTYSCICSSGWNFADGTCNEVNECIVNNNPCNDNGDNAATCTNTTGSYTCGCTFGFEFTLGGCHDLDECSLGTDTCHVNADCANTTGSYTCTCKTHYSGNGYTCTADTQIFTCADKPVTGTVWNTVSSYTQTWNGTAWSPVDSTTTYNATASTTECRYKCATNYTWNGSICVADTRTFTCAAKPANGTEWNTVSSYIQTWNGTAWSPADSMIAYNATGSTTECRYWCATDYYWNGSSCVSTTRMYFCPAKPTTGTDWNTVASYEQTWNGSEWLPTGDAETEYSTVASTIECRYKCALNYTWDGSVCVADTRIFTCAAKPSNSTWNTVSSYSQTWDSSAWIPADTTPQYNETASTIACRFKCNTNYTWNGSACAADTRTFNCSSVKPANTEWNTVDHYTQTWTGSAWSPADSTNAYSTTASTTSCRFKCQTNYSWTGSTCVADTRTFTCAAKPATGTDWNTVSSYSQTWGGSAWVPADSVTAYDESPSTTACRYICATNYHWTGSACVSNSRTYTCPSKPATGTTWNTVSSYPQTWTGSAWTPADSTTQYNETASTTECRYMCATDYYWNGSVCVRCLDDSYCGGVKPYCLLPDGICVQCRDGNDCNVAEGEPCNTTTHFCGWNVCGDGILGGDEQCETGSAANCSDLGFTCGTAACSDECQWDTSTCYDADQWGAC